MKNSVVSICGNEIKLKDGTILEMKILFQGRKTVYKAPKKLVGKSCKVTLSKDGIIIVRLNGCDYFIGKIKEEK